MSWPLSLILPYHIIHINCLLNQYNYYTYNTINLEESGYKIRQDVKDNSIQTRLTRYILSLCQ